MKGAFSDGTLTLERQNGDIEIPIATTSGRKLVTSGDISQFITNQSRLYTVSQDFEIEYLWYTQAGYVTGTQHAIIHKGIYPRAPSKILLLGYCRGRGEDDSYVGSASGSDVVHVQSFGDIASIYYEEDLSSMNRASYRLYV